MRPDWQQTDEPADWTSFVQHQRSLASWTLSGRLGIQTEHEGGSFDLHWKQRGDRYTIRLIAPLGRGTVLLHGDREGISIRTTDGRSRFSTDPDALFAEMTGIELPVSALHDWLRGLPVANAAINEISWDDAGRLYRLRQLGWRIEMSRYQPQAGFVVPHAFYLEHRDRKELNVRLVIRSWDIPVAEEEAAS